MAKRKNRFGMLYIITILFIAALAAGFYVLTELRDASLNKAVNVDKQITAGESLEVHGIDVGQGGCVLVKCGGLNALIDAGDVGNDEKIDSYLKAQGVEKLDLVVITHPHADHIGSMKYILENYEVKQLMMPRLDKKVIPTTKLYNNLLKTIKDKNISTIQAEPGAQISFGQAAFTVLAPIGEYKELNNYSVVMRLDFGNRSFIFTGDAEKESEEDIISSGRSLKADVLWVGHHGGSTSTSDAFLDKINPVAAFIQCSQDNKYNHPHKETVERLSQRSIKTMRTDLDGSIVFATDGKELSVTTEKGMSEKWNG